MTGSIERVRENIIGLRPVYTEYGNCTEIMLASGELLLDKRSLKSVLSGVARNYAIDMKAQKETVEQMLGRRSVMPFYIKKRVFVPLKMRQRVSGNDMVYGYVDVKYIKDIPEQLGRRSVVELTTGQIFELYSSAATARKSLHLGLDLQKSLGAESELDQAEAVVVQAARIIMYEFRDIGAKLERLEEMIAER